MSEATSEIKAKEAIQFAFRHFSELFSDPNLDHILLEEVERVGDEWCVVIGFDAGRRRQVAGSPMLLTANSYEPIREFRKFFISASDGSLSKMK